MMDKKMCGGMCWGHKIAMALLVLGGIHLGLVSAFNISLPEMLFGSMDHPIPWAVNILIGISALMVLAMGKCCMKHAWAGCGSCEMCKGGMMGGGKTCSCGTCDSCKAAACKDGSCTAPDHAHKS